MSASLLPTCPFCRKRLESLVVLREEARTVTRESVITDQQLFDRLMMSLIKWISYVMLAIVLIILPVVQVYFTENEEAFLSYFCLILFIFIFLCCQYMKRVERAEEEHDDGSELTV
jgi:amino acid permease